ncbi:MAG: amidase [Betaproteobacteria bacterium]|jgi:aspartyl-tRNA(Asn)/glutamyl-tRNA(Gln) amidotransferase subunit A|nr:MAG: amidase [Betaproteobacteria bacterium]
MSVFDAYATIAELGRALRAGSVAPTALAQAYLQRIDQLDGKLGAFKRVTPERAMAQARAAEAEMGAGIDRGPLHGIPYAAKDLYDVAGMPTTAGCPLLESNIAKRDCAVIRKLNDAGAVLLGKTVTVQFAYGGAGINNQQGTPHNPWHLEAHLPGGSSSGSAVAVASGMAPMALGSDTGGSVRIPAALCGVSGLKTTVGQISRAGVYPLSWSLDSVGPLTRSAEDAALVYAAIAGADPEDPSTRDYRVSDVLSRIDDGVDGLRLAFAQTVFFDDADDQVAAMVRATGDVFRGLGAQVSSVAFPQAQQAVDLNPRGLVIAAEAYTLNRELLDNHFDELDPVVAYRMIKGAETPAHEYLRTELNWNSLRKKTMTQLANIDALLCPTVMIPATPVAEVARDIDRYSKRNVQCLRNTSVGNILNLCAVTVPCGITSDGLPVGLMIYGKSFDEAMVLRIARAYQKATDWHMRHPKLDWI